VVRRCARGSVGLSLATGGRAASARAATRVSLAHRRTIHASRATYAAGAPPSKEQPKKSAAELEQERELSLVPSDFLLPMDWDLQYLAKFDVPPPPQEMIEKALEPPVRLFGKVGDYASSLFRVASAHNILDQIFNDLVSFKKLADATPSLVRWLDDKAGTKAEVKVLFEEAFAQAHPVLRMFFSRLVESNDFFLVLQISEAFDELMRALRKEVSVTVAFAKLPQGADLDKAKQRLAFLHLPKDSNPIWTIKERPELLHGYTLMTPDTSVDRSYSRTLKEVQDRLDGALARMAAAEVKVKHPLFEPPPATRKWKPGDIAKLAKENEEKRQRRKKLQEEKYKQEFVDWV